MRAREKKREKSCDKLIKYLIYGYCCSRLVIARTLDQRHLDDIVMVDKSVRFKPLAEALLRK